MVATPQRATLADLDATPDDGQRYELIDGEIVVAAAPNWKHQRVSRAIFMLLDAWVEQRGLGAVQYAPFDVVLDEFTVVEPDIVFISTAKIANVRGKYYGVPDLAVEIVSPTNASHDTVTKMFHYARAGIPEYWLVDPGAQTFLVLSLTDRIYAPVTPGVDGRLASKVLPGLIVDPTPLLAAGDIPGGHR